MDKKCSPIRIGGQAVMEGVMMKGKELYSVSVRRSDGSIITRVFDEKSRFAGSPLVKIPVVRGVFRFIESLTMGMKTLTYSSSFFMEETPEEKEKKAKKKKTRLNTWYQEHEEGITTGISVVLGVIMALALFVFLPVLISSFLHQVITNNLLLNLIEGVVRVMIFLLYIWGVSHIKDIARVFEYHGAEHKTINCFEAGEDLTVENVMKYTRLNRRCGTSFLFLVMAISILVFAFIQIYNPMLKMLTRLLMIPVVAGLSYEVLMYSNTHDNPVINVLVAPGLALQKMTTREPDEKEIETAIASTLSVLDAEGMLPDSLKERWEEVKGQVELVGVEKQ